MVVPLTPHSAPSCRWVSQLPPQLAQFEAIHRFLSFSVPGLGPGKIFPTPGIAYRSDFFGNVKPFDKILSAKNQ